MARARASCFSPKARGLPMPKPALMRSAQGRSSAVAAVAPRRSSQPRGPLPAAHSSGVLLRASPESSPQSPILKASMACSSCPTLARTLEFSNIRAAKSTAFALPFKCVKAYTNLSMSTSSVSSSSIRWKSRFTDVMFTSAMFSSALNFLSCNLRSSSRLEIFPERSRSARLTTFRSWSMAVLSCSSCSCTARSASTSAIREVLSTKIPVKIFSMPKTRTTSYNTKATTYKGER
mmetsp:Transcript_75206/g.207464  ORF Transcript_75206/g.207464 Transcript_75206/m.207464 type:complete len:234 (-) Transcript_75206:1030-1731(-)